MFHTGQLRYFLVIALAVLASIFLNPGTSILILALLSFVALREYISLLDIRIEDRYGILVSYISIPFLFYLVWINWYGLFIISIPVYTFLIVPYFIAIGGRTKGITFSVGAINFGLFFFVFCLGHLAYMTAYAPEISALVIIAILISDLLARKFPNKYFHYAIFSLLIITPFLVLVGPLVELSLFLCLSLSVIITALVFKGHLTLNAIGKDLGIRPDRLEPGRGLALDSLKAYLYSIPVIFHYLRWLIHIGDPK
jgi:phosphatidate cytidylyltransferase